ncbi:hypothetical protein BKA61DRAFT_685112 [Leptodontidium sp. MPI-SDFR-AT-0119]|nr:hypothetical protein BKA61DRAFT_685112 [Leptodontidium sp. MPI-SDFR-AT-0119]
MRLLLSCFLSSCAWLFLRRYFLVEMAGEELSESATATYVHLLAHSLQQFLPLRGQTRVEERRTYTKQARQHYGLVLGLPFREGIVPKDLAYDSDWDNSKRCGKRMKWLIQKRGFAEYKRLKLFASSLNVAPEYSSDPRVVEVGCIVSTLSSKSRYNPALGNTIHRSNHQVRVKFGDKGSNMTYQDVVNGEVISTARIEVDRP